MNYINKLFSDKYVNEKFVILKDAVDKSKNFSNENVDKIITTIETNTINNLKFNTSFYRDLEIFETYDNDKSNNTVFDRINNTYTKGGESTFKKIIENPLNITELLINRKKSLLQIDKLVEKDKYDKIIDSLKILKDKEQSIYWFLNANNEDFDSMKKMLYFPRFLYFLNQSGTAVSIKNIYKIFLSPVVGILSPIWYFILPFCILKYKFKINISFVAYIRQVVQTLISMYKLAKPKLLSLNNLWIGFSALIYFQNIITSVDLSKLYTQLSSFIISKVNDLSEYTKNTKIISDILYKEEYIKHFYTYVKPIEYPDALLTLNVHTYEYIHNFGSKLSIYKTFDKEFMNKLLAQSYIVDAIFNICTTTRKFKMQTVDYIIDSIDPVLNITNFFHPLIKKDENLITNSAIIDNNKNMIITGPNAAGKSTYIKAMAVNTLLAQTICVCFAENFSLTVFNYIASQINTYDINGQKSLFQAEMYNIKNILDDISLHSSLDKSQKSIIFLDELFNSTNIVEGVAASYSICDMLSTIPTNLTVFATHFLYLCKLAKTKKYINYKFEAECTTVDDKLNIYFPYKIKKGISNQYIALEILKLNNFNKKIIDDAIIIKEKIMSLKKE